jgi:hypothetical protein
VMILNAIAVIFVVTGCREVGGFRDLGSVVRFHEVGSRGGFARAEIDAIDTDLASLVRIQSGCWIEFGFARVRVDAIDLDLGSLVQFCWRCRIEFGFARAGIGCDRHGFGFARANSGGNAALSLGSLVRIPDLGAGNTCGLDAAKISRVAANLAVLSSIRSFILVGF